MSRSRTPADLSPAMIAWTVPLLGDGGELAAAKNAGGQAGQDRAARKQPVVWFRFFPVVLLAILRFHGGSPAQKQEQKQRLFVGASYQQNRQGSNPLLVF